MSCSIWTEHYSIATSTISFSRRSYHGGTPRFTAYSSKSRATPSWRCTARLKVNYLPTGDVAAAITAARKLRGAGRQIVIATGIGDGDDLIATLAVHDDGVDIVTTPRIAITANGTGDSLAAIFLARWLATRDVAGALAHAVSSLCVLLHKTAATGARELELIAAQDAIVAPEPLHRARRIA